METLIDTRPVAQFSPLGSEHPANFSWDKLTGLADRQYLLHTLRSWLGAKCSPPVTVMLFNIDDFKAINRSVGHRIGDRWLCAIARRLQARAGEHCVIGRFSGDEFLLISRDPQLAVSEVCKRAQRISIALSRPVAVGGQVMMRHVSASSSSSHGREVYAEQLLGDVERQMRLKRRSRQHMPRAKLKSTEEFRDLQRAIDAGRQIEVHYQPEIDLCSGHVVGVEALARWRHPRKGLQPASRFIGLAERSGLVVPLSWLVLHRALHQTVIWQQRHPLDNFTLRVNASPLQVMSEGFAKDVLEALSFHGLAASILCIEVTEHQVMKCKGVAESELRKLREHGVRVAIDDFGIGHSSLGRLKDLPADCLKIDRSFVRACHINKRERALVETIARLADIFDMDVVAEGIENEEELAFLRGLGIGLGQGEFFAMALEADACERLFESSFYDSPALKSEPVSVIV